MAEFDLAKLMKDVSGADTGKQRIQYIPLDLIDPSPENFYSLEGLDELAGSIEMLGLQQPLLVRPTKGGRYTVISGHRRRASIMLICDGGSTQFADGVPCIVDTSAASEALQELKLIMANADTRKLTSADQSKQAERIEDLLRQLEDEGFEFPGRLRDWVAKITGMSRSKLGRLKVIREKLIPQFREKWEQGDINETCAYELAQSPEWIQKRIFSASPAAGLAQGVEAIRKNMLDGIEYADNQLSGPGCNRCTHGNAFLRHDLENPYNQCHGKTCCLECREAASSYSPCARMCSKAKPCGQRRTPP